MEDNIEIENISISDYMILLDEVENYWHGDSFGEEYFNEYEKIRSVLNKPSTESFMDTKWSIKECQIYANEIDIYNWKTLNWRDLSPLITRFDRIDLLTDLLREQILVFYKNGLLENDSTFKKVILNYIKDFDTLKRNSTDDDFSYIFNNGFCEVANAMYDNDFESAKEKFISFALELKDKSSKCEDVSKPTLVKSYIKKISERR